MRRPVRAVLAALVAASALAACGDPEDTATVEIRRAIAKTEAAPRRFVYEEEANDRKVVVEGLVEDDFRYKARLLFGTVPAVDEVVVDDALADRFLDVRALPLLAATPGRDPTAEPLGADVPIEAPGDVLDVPTALKTKRWVLDRTGAPSLIPTADEQHQLGDDAIYDALTVFRYVDRVLRETEPRKFNENDLDYKPQEDPFPKPQKGSGVTRYDFPRVRVPRPADAGGSGNQAVPGANSFRKMSVYVKDGIVVQILEDMDVASRLEDLARNYDVDFGDASVEQAVKIAIDGINAVRRGQGTEPIRVRKLSFRISDYGTEVRVELPTTDVVEGNLNILRNRGRQVTRPTSGRDA